MSIPLKPWISIESQISQLQRRGMLVDEEEARIWLSAVGYYRLSGYWHPYIEKSAHPQMNDEARFSIGTEFHEVVRLYEFDRKLRELALSAVERIEVSFRSQLSYQLGRHDPEGHLSKSNFCSEEDHREINALVCKRIDRARSSNDPIAIHHEEKYSGRYPIWAVTEFFDFSDISKLYAAVVPEKKFGIAEHFGFAPASDGFNSGVRGKLQGWLHNLTIVRNIAAHHSRLWNRPFKPTSGKQVRHLTGMSSLPKSNTRVFGSLSTMAFLLQTVSPGSTWTAKIRNLVATDFSQISMRSLDEMEFPSDWQENSIFAP